MKQHTSLIAAPLLLTLAACSSDTNHDFDGNKAELDAQIAASNPPQALFSPDPAAAVLPFPNSLFLVGVTDGTLNLPIDADEDQTLANPVAALNQLDGYSTTAPLSTTVSEPLAPESLIVGSTIRVYEVTTAQSIAVTGVVSEISDPARMVAQSVGDQLVLVPTVPLNPSSDYLVVLTSDITDVDGNALEASLLYDVLKADQSLTDESLEQLRVATRTHLAAVEGFSGIDASDVALSWVFRTQSTREVLQAASDQTSAGTLMLGASGQTSPAGGKADVYIGSLDVPYYLTAATEQADIPVALNSFWTNVDGNVVGTFNESDSPDYSPVATSTQTIPVLMSVPNASADGGGVMPANGWPVTVYQHGIGGDRSHMLAIADAMADAGRVVIAIDMPLHGITDPDSALHADQTPFDESERTFGIDLMTNPAEDGSAVEDTGPDGLVDPSGQYFINLSNLANSRDNLRQAVADLMTLRASLSAAQVEGVQLDASDLSLIGHSLGGIVGGTLLAFDSSYHSATLAMPGGGIAQLLANSPRFSPTIIEGLAGAGIEAGSAEFNTFLVAAQTLIDSADPINHAASVAAAGNTQVHMIEVLGDTVVPNNVATAPLSGTDPLARQMGLSQITETAAGGGIVRFSAGDHGSIISPEASLEATVEMQTQTATFAATQGTVLPIGDDSVIAPAQ